MATILDYIKEDVEQVVSLDDVKQWLEDNYLKHIEPEDVMDAVEELYKL